MRIMIKKIFLIASNFYLTSLACAFSIGVPKTLIDSEIIKKFPIEKYTVTIDHPITKFKKEIKKIEICGSWSEKLTQALGDFCVDAQPRWNKSKGAIEISKINVLKMTVKDFGELPASLSHTLNTSVLILLDGISVYQAPDFIGKHLESIQVDDSSIKLNF